LCSLGAAHPLQIWREIRGYKAGNRKRHQAGLPMGKKMADALVQRDPCSFSVLREIHSSCASARGGRGKGGVGVWGGEKKRTSFGSSRKRRRPFRLPGKKKRALSLHD